MTQDDTALKFGATQVDESILESQFFVRKFSAFQLERRRLAARQNGELSHSDFDLAGLKFWIDQPIAAISNFTDDLDHIFTAKFASDRINLGVFFFRDEDNLSFPVAVAQVDKDKFFTLFSVAVNPASKGDRWPACSRRSSPQVCVLCTEMSLGIKRVGE